jgi:hypothetical protein
MDIALSISYDHETGKTCALLLGCSDLQTAFIIRQLKSLAGLTSHPILLPTLMSGYFRSILETYTQTLWRNLLNLEHESGVTGVPLYDRDGPLPTVKCEDYTPITTALLGLIQLGLSWENYVKQLLFMVETIQECRTHVNFVTADAGRECIRNKAAILDERLRFISHKASILEWRLQFILGRTQAQMTAVSPFISLSYPDPVKLHVST